MKHEESTQQTSEDAKAQEIVEKIIETPAKEQKVEPTPTVEVVTKTTAPAKETLPNPAPAAPAQPKTVQQQP